MKKLNILFDARMVRNEFHGIGRYAKTLIQGLADRGHRITLLSSNFETEKLIGEKYIREVIPCKLPFAHPAECGEISVRVLGRDYDIFHFPSFSVPLVVTPRTVITIHDLIHLHVPNPKILHRIYYRLVAQNALKRAGAVLAVSQWTKTELQKILHVPEEKITVIRNGLSEKWFAPGDAIELVEPSTPYFLCLANLKAHKNIDTLVEACRRLWKAGLHFNLKVSFGNTTLPERWNLSPAEKARIHFLDPNASDDAILAALRGCRALVSPSVFEGFNYPVAEALAQRREVILSRGSGHNEYRGSGVVFYGLPQDVAGLEEAMTQSLKTRRESDAGKSLHHRDEMVEETLAVYRRLAITTGGL